MKLKWYICTLIVSLTLLSVIQRQQINIPNQEIVIQFQDKALSASNAEISITNIKQRLQEIGVTSVEVVSSEDGLFRIVYYSDTDVNSIKEELSSESLLVFNDTNSSPKDKSSNYDFEVFEIKDAKDSKWDFDGHLVDQFNFKSDRSFQLEFYNSAITLKEKHLDSYNHLALKVNRDITFVSDNTSYNIPEVRAGPYLN